MDNLYEEFSKTTISSKTWSKFSQLNGDQRVDLLKCLINDYLKYNQNNKRYNFEKHKKIIFDVYDCINTVPESVNEIINKL